MEKIIIAAMSLDSVIGNQNRIPWDIPEDRKHFMDLTLGHPVIMGRKTFDSIIDLPPHTPLKQRTNIVISKNPRLYDDVVFCTSLDNAFKVAQEFDDKAYIIGGGEIYKQALEMADKLELTVVKSHVMGDAYFPEVNWNEWEISKIEDHNRYSFLTYNRK